jgi:hypothetical protein
MEPREQTLSFLINAPVKRIPAASSQKAGLHNYLPPVSFFQAEKKIRNLSEVPGGRFTK